MLRGVSTFFKWDWLFGRGNEILTENEKDYGVGCSCFISFSRKDKVFVKHIYDSLITTNRNIWVDWEDNPPGNDWLDEIHKGIERSDTFICVLSPDSITSEVTNFEIDHAVRNGKRIIPIVCRDVDYKQVRKEVGNVNWIFFKQDGDDFDTGIRLLTKSLDNDMRHVWYHTKLLCRAIEWEKKDFEKSLLLGRQDLKRAKNWLSASALGKEPKPTTLHLSFITTSEAANTGRVKRLLLSIGMIIIVAISIIWPSWGAFFFALVFAHFYVFILSN